MPEPKVHVSADVPADLLNLVDEKVKALGLTRSYAIRRGLLPFLSANRQKLTEIVNRASDDKAPEASHVG